MVKMLCLVMLSFWVAACSAHDQKYYRLNPHKLESALKACEKQSMEQQDCQRLEATAREVETRAIQLRSNPQQFGQQILSLQETIAKQKQALKTTPDQSELIHQLIQNEQELQENLAIVKWLESPDA